VPDEHGDGERESVEHFLSDAGKSIDERADENGDRRRRLTPETTPPTPHKPRRGTPRVTARTMPTIDPASIRDSRRSGNPMLSWQTGRQGRYPGRPVHSTIRSPSATS
jgi:hypothetical protein